MSNIIIIGFEYKSIVLNVNYDWLNSFLYQVTIEDPDTGVKTTGTTCPPALGFSFIGIDPSPIWEFIRDILFQKPSDELAECHLYEKY